MLVLQARVGLFNSTCPNLGVIEEMLRHCESTGSVNNSSEELLLIYLVLCHLPDLLLACMKNDISIRHEIYMSKSQKRVRILRLREDPILNTLT